MRPLDEAKQRIVCKKNRYFKNTIKAAEERECDIAASVVQGVVSFKCVGESYGYSFDIGMMKELISDTYKNNIDITGGN